MSSDAPGAATEVVVVDHDPIVRRAVVTALCAGGVEVVADVASGREGIQQIIEHGAGVVIVDPDLRDMPGLEFVREVHAAMPWVGILLLASADTEDFALRALRDGAAGYLSKRIALEALPRIVRSVAAGEAVITRTLTMRLIERLRQAPDHGIGLRPVRSSLSSREWEVLDLIRAGVGTREIASELDLSVETVRSHVKRILRKLGVHTRGEAAEVAETLVEVPPVPGEPLSRPGGARFTRR